MNLKHLFSLAALLLLSAAGCEKDNVLDTEFEARIEGFDADACFNPAYDYNMLYIIHWQPVE